MLSFEEKTTSSTLRLIKARRSLRSRGAIHRSKIQFGAIRVLPQPSQHPNSTPLIMTLIEVRVVDGYVNATKLCRDMGKRFNTYWRTASAKNFVSALSLLERIDVFEDVNSTSTAHIIPRYLVYFGDGKTTPTWVHPDIGTVVNIRTTRTSSAVSNQIHNRVFYFKLFI